MNKKFNVIKLDDIIFRGAIEQVLNIQTDTGCLMEAMYAEDTEDIRPYLREILSNIQRVEEHLETAIPIAGNIAERSMLRTLAEKFSNQRDFFIDIDNKIKGVS